MKTEALFLKPNIQVEPLVNRWYAWVQIIPPTTAAFNIVDRHIKTMAAYIQSPDLHAAAVADPKMRGGPFLDLQGGQVDEVRDLLAQTRDAATLQIEFVQAVRDLDVLLKSQAIGFSMQPLYAEIPKILRGRVELYYDRHHRPDFRLYEPLFYQSPLYSPDFQSVALTSITEDCSRPFVFSTPRLTDPDTVHLQVPFANAGLDALFRAKRRANTLSDIRESLGVSIPPEQEALFQDFFTPEPPKPYPTYDGDRMRIRYFGHACILIEWRGVSILIDPVLSYTYETDISRYTYDDLPDVIDYVLITHSHHDHILLETMLQIRHKVGEVVVPRSCTGALQDPSLKIMLEQIGFSNVRELGEFETINIADGEITGVPFLGEHHDLLVESKLTYHIRAHRKTVLAMADSCNISPELYAHIHAIIGDIDVLFLGMECDGAPASWVYGPLFTDKPEREKDRSRRGRGCNCAEGMDLVRRFGPREIYVYAMGEEPWVRYILGVEYTEASNPIIQSNLLIEACRTEGRVAERLYGEREVG